MSKPLRRKVSTLNTDTPEEACVDENGIVEVETFNTDVTEEEVSEDIPENESNSEIIEEDSDTEATFNYPTMDDMEDKEEDEPKFNADVHFIGSTSKKDTPDARVKVRISCHKQFTIGGERYDMYPGNTYLVPKNVKDVLQENDLLRPL